MTAVMGSGERPAGAAEAPGAAGAAACTATVREVVVRVVPGRWEVSATEARARMVPESPGREDAGRRPAIAIRLDVPDDRVPVQVSDRTSQLHPARPW